MALILTRRINERLNIGDDIEITVLGIEGNQVKVAIDAPRDIPVHRSEIYDRIVKENNGQNGHIHKRNESRSRDNFNY